MNVDCVCTCIEYMTMLAKIKKMSKYVLVLSHVPLLVCLQNPFQSSLDADYIVDRLLVVCLSNVKDAGDYHQVFICLIQHSTGESCTQFTISYPGANIQTTILGSGAPSCYALSLIFTIL